MKNTTIAALLFVSTFNVMAAVPDGKIEKPFSFNNEVDLPPRLDTTLS
ncbi:hypothetical protein [Enterobacter asburiae]